MRDTLEPANQDTQQRDLRGEPLNKPVTDDLVIAETTRWMGIGRTPDELAAQTAATKVSDYVSM